MKKEKGQIRFSFGGNSFVLEAFRAKKAPHLYHVESEARRVGPRNTHLNSEEGSISSVDLLVLTG